IAFIQTNRSTIIASPSGGFITYGSSNSSLTNVTLGNGSKFSVVYTNPTANDYTLILITSTGTSADNTSTSTVRQLVKFKPLLVNVPNNPSTVRGTAHVGGSATVINNGSGNVSIIAGGSITFQGN